MSEETENEMPEEDPAAPSEETPDPDDTAEELLGPDATDEELELFAAPDGHEELLGEIADLKDKLLRAVAETENVRRRAQRDKEDASKYAIQSFAAEMISVADNLGRALDSVDSATRDTDEAVDNLCTGVEMTQRELLNTFERIGIKLIEAEGTQFNHNLHEALFEVEDPDKPTGTVVQVIQAGYTIRDRLLRPAKVGVSKGGPKESAPKPGVDNDKPSEIHNEEADGAAKAYGQPNQTGSQLDEEL